ncbi:MAG: esterase [Deltaproteobacteria bacterium]|nr:esterase [Deltaproteobacteria bacterium]
MAERSFDKDFLPYLSEIPTIQDFSSPEKIQAIREMRTEMMAAPADRDDVTMEDRTIPGLEGAPDIPIRIYRPIAASDGTRPGLLEIHGGGFMLGNIEMMDAWCQMIAAQVDAVVVSVGYRLAPEDPFPAGLEDCYAALSWTAEQADELDLDPERLAIAGQSAGGGLAAGLALMARDRGGPAICFQLLEIPELDDRLDTPSMLAFTDTPFWNRPNAQWSWKHYLGPDHSGEPSPYAAPARAIDVAGLPPAYVSTMEFDPLRDEGIRYAMKMLEAGISVELHNYAGTFHGSAFVPAEPTRRNTEEIVRILQRRLHP